MKKYIYIDVLNSFVKKRKLEVFIDRVSFKELFAAWFFIVLAMGFVYYYSADSVNYLAYQQSDVPVDLLDSIYFSFVTATSTGYGDIIPMGLNKLWSIIQVIFSLGLFAIATSKLISIKQETILSEIYEISFSEKINRIRSSLYLFRIDLNKVMFKIEEERLKRREVFEIWTYFSFFENIIADVNLLVSNKKNEDFIKRIDSVDLELLLNGINQSISRIHDTIVALNNSRYEWRRDVTLNVIKKSLDKSEKLFNLILKTYIDNGNIHHIEEEFSKKRNDILAVLG